MECHNFWTGNADNDVSFLQRASTLGVPVSICRSDRGSVQAALENLPPTPHL